MGLHDSSMGQQIVGQPLAAAILKHSKEEASILAARGITPTLAVVLVGYDKPSHTYVEKKKAAAREAGVDFHCHEFSDNITTDELIASINTIQNDPLLSGLIVQLPLPAHIDASRIVNTIRPDLDVDCLTDINLGRLVTNAPLYIPPTTRAILTILESIDATLTGKQVTIVGAGTLVGKPFAIMGINQQATVTICNSETADLAAHTRIADILVTGVGKKHLITGTMIKPGAIVIDAGVEIIDGKSYGDVEIASTTPIAAYVTPTPGGVGPITVAHLLANTLIAAHKKAQN